MGYISRYCLFNHYQTLCSGGGDCEAFTFTAAITVAERVTVVRVIFLQITTVESRPFLFREWES